MRHRVVGAFTSVVLLCPAILLSSPAYAKGRVKPYDFNGDGYPELVVGAPHLQVGSHVRAGGVVVLPASRRGLSLKEQVVTQSSRRVVGASETDDNFGASIASADFDRDGYADLAVGQAGEKAGDVMTGGVTILFGSAKGLRGKRSVRLNEPGAPEGRSVFGSKIATADFDGDGWADLAVGDPIGDFVNFPDEDFGAEGTVAVFRGGRAGFLPARSLLLHGVRTRPGFDVGFGTALAVGDLNDDERTDLVVGSRGESYDDGDGYDGSVSACYGTADGLSGCIQLAQGPEFAGFSSLAVGNVFGSPRAEVVAGVPSAELQESPGTVQTLSLSGTGSGTTAAVSTLTQESPGVPGTDQDRDSFGSDVVLGDLDRDGFADLVVGSPSEVVGNAEYAGQAVVVYGGPTGYRTTGGLAYDQDTPGIPGRAELHDAFGSSVALFDHDSDGHLDLTVSAPGENTASGAVSTLTGRGTSFTSQGSRTVTLKTLGYSTPDNANLGEVLGR